MSRMPKIFKGLQVCPFLKYPLFQANQQFMEKYNCTLPWMNSSKLKLCPILDENRTEDFHELTKNWISMLDRVKTCPIHSHCTRPIYRFPNLNIPQINIIKFYLRDFTRLDPILKPQIQVSEKLRLLKLWYCKGKFFLRVKFWLVISTKK